MSLRTGTLLIFRDIGAEWGRQQAGELGRNLELRLNQPVAVCFPEDPDAPLIAGIQSLMDAGTRRLVVVPLGLLPVPERGSISQSIVWAKRQWPFLNVHAAAPLTWLEWSGWLGLAALDALNERAIQPTEAAVLLVGQSSADPLANANLARLAHLVQESRSLACVSHAFSGAVRPGISEALRDLSRLGHRNVVVILWQFTEGEDTQRLRDEVVRAAQAHNLNATLRMPPLAHGALINVLVSNHYAALSNESVPSVTEAGSDPNLNSASGSSTRSSRTGVAAEVALELQELERRINAMLPPEYQGRYENVLPQSMGTAGLKFDSDGKVAWDEIWTSFCDLALAGGPPHRGTLLEPVTAAETLAEPEQYQAVVAEIERGIRMVTGLPVVASSTPGWVGVRCQSEEMAIWLMRAIIVENVMVRREREVLYLPAGPRFTLKREIKNVITAIAKTVHYWSAHLTARRQSGESDA
jgi:sirohydrochlorin cobaltochelatase